MHVIQTNLLDFDKEVYRAKKKALRIQAQMEVRKLRGYSLDEDDDSGSEYDEGGEVEWIWDEDKIGMSFRIEDLGRKLRLHGEDSEDDVIWEYRRDNRGYNQDDDGDEWETFNEVENTALEEKFLEGVMYSGCRIDFEDEAQGRTMDTWVNTIEIESDMVTGFRADWPMHNYESLDVRRRGPRKVVPNEPELSESQKFMDKRMESMRKEQKKYRKIYAIARKGKDVEASRGSASLTPNSGTHTWSLKWLHEPVRAGRGDAVGLCSESYENYGPCKEPCLGGDKESTSIALYASGEIFMNGECIYKVKHQRTKTPLVLPVASSPTRVEKEPVADSTAITPATTSDQPLKKKSPKSFKFGSRVYVERDDTTDLADNFGSVTRVAKDKKSYVILFDDEQYGYGVEIDDIQVREEVNVNEAADSLPASCWGQDSIVTVVLDSAYKNGLGRLTFEVDGTALDWEFVDVFNKLGGTPVFPCVSTCPLKGEEEDDEDDDASVGDSEEEEETTVVEAPVVEEDAGKKRLRMIATLRMFPDFTEEESGSVMAMSNTEIQGLLDTHIANRLAMQPKFPTIVILREEDEAKTKEEDAKKEGESTESTNETTEETPEAMPIPAIEEELPIERVVWMYETNEGWVPYPVKISAALETARRAGRQDLHVRVGGAPVYVKLVVNSENNSEPEQRADNGQVSKVRRHVKSEGLRGEWEMLSLQFNMNVGRTLIGSSALDLLEKVWNGKEDMNGKKCGGGFLLLYTLLQGQMRCRIVSGSKGRGFGGFGGMYGGFGNGGGGKGGYSAWVKKQRSSQGTDSHRLATLLAQLYSDIRTKSVMASIINVMVRNKQLGVRMPKFKDTRKVKKGSVFNGWVDEKEPTSPLGDMFNTIVPTLVALKRKRGTILFPPKPPYPELDRPAETCQVVVIPHNRSVESWTRPELGDYACDARSMQAVSSDEIASLATHVGYRLGGLAVTAHAPQDIEESKLFASTILQEDSVAVVMFHAQWCSSCISMGPVFRTMAMETPVVRFFKVDVDECGDLFEKFKGEKVPFTVTLRNTVDPTEVSGSITGGGPKWVVLMDEQLDELLSGEEKAILKNHREEVSGKKLPSLKESLKHAGALETSSTDVDKLAKKPLEDLTHNVAFLTREQMGMPLVAGDLPFDISSHDNARTAVAQSMLVRMKEDVQSFASAANSGRKALMKCLTKGCAGLPGRRGEEGSTRDQGYCGQYAGSQGQRRGHGGWDLAFDHACSQLCGLAVFVERGREE